MIRCVFVFLLFRGWLLLCYSRGLTAGDSDRSGCCDSELISVEKISRRTGLMIGGRRRRRSDPVVSLSAALTFRYRSFGLSCSFAVLVRFGRDQMTFQGPFAQSIVLTVDRMHHRHLMHLRPNWLMMRMMMRVMIPLMTSLPLVIFFRFIRECMIHLSRSRMWRRLRLHSYDFVLRRVTARTARLIHYLAAVRLQSDCVCRAWKVGFGLNRLVRNTGSVPTSFRSVFTGSAESNVVAVQRTRFGRFCNSKCAMRVLVDCRLCYEPIDRSYR
jgi:hypothetical protein